MKIRLGIVGAADTVDKIKTVAKEFEEQIEIVVYSYKNKNETVKLLKNCEDKVDVIVFSGQVPYVVAQQEKVITKPSVYVPRTGTSLYRAFWQMKERGIDYTKISFDTIEKKAVEEVVKELDIPIEKLYVKSYPGDIDYNELVEYHYKLWKEKKINIVATCLSKTFEKLRTLGVPVLKLYPTIPLIREYIHKAIYIGDVKKIKATQIAVQIVKIKNKTSNMSSEYEFLKLKNKLEETLIQYTQDSFGSVFPFGRDEYLIFSTRGAIESQWKNHELYKKITLHDQSLQMKVASGIGFGNTVYEAEANARVALGYAEEEDYNCCFMVDENGQISGPIGEEGKTLSYELAVINEEMQEIAEKVQVSAAYLSKIKAIIQKIGTNKVNAEELANYLGVSVRSGRRILKRITDAGYGKVIATESTANTGRPRQIYEIFL
ncbi:hypothetical protein QBE52_16170 [Clostridiaceae bacterium 35-E11]